MAAALGQSANDLEAVVTTGLGTFRFAFAPDKAPKHVEHFITLARQGFYDGSAFHRVVSYGIVQGGDPLLKDAKTPRKLWGSGGLNQLAGEFSDLKHERGVVSTVSIPGKPDSDGAQFSVHRAEPRWMASSPPSGGSRRHGRGGEDLAIARTPRWLAEKPVRVLKVAIEKEGEPFAGATRRSRTVTVKTTLGPSRSRWSRTGRPPCARS